MSFSKQYHKIEKLKTNNFFMNNLKVNIHIQHTNFVIICFCVFKNISFSITFLNVSATKVIRYFVHNFLFIAY